MNVMLNLNEVKRKNPAIAIQLRIPGFQYIEGNDVSCFRHVVRKTAVHVSLI